VIHVPGVQRDPLAVRITGIVAPRDPEGVYWTTQPLLRTPSLIRPPTQGAEPETYWLGALLLPPDAAPGSSAPRASPRATGCSPRTPPRSPRTTCPGWAARSPRWNRARVW
jgi:hypothetical protein